MSKDYKHEKLPMKSFIFFNLTFMFYDDNMTIILTFLNVTFIDDNTFL